MTQVSEHFTLAELTRSDWAIRHGVPNDPGPEEIARLQLLCAKVLEPTRAHFGRPMVINSAYRSPRVNRAIGGAPSSQHAHGEAADIDIPGVSNAVLAQWIWKNLNYDQLILEYYVPGVPGSGWVHVSYSAHRMRNQELTKVPGEAGYREGLVL